MPEEVVKIALKTLSILLKITRVFFIEIGVSKYVVQSAIYGQSTTMNMGKMGMMKSKNGEMTLINMINDFSEMITMEPIIPET